MRVPRREIPIQPLTYMWERHKEIARLVVSGLRPKDICEKLGMTACRISLIMNSPVFKEYLAGLSEQRDEKAFDIKAELEKGAVKGVQRLNEFLDDSEVPKPVKAKIAMDFLDRTGYGKVSISKGEVEHRVVTSSRIEQLKEEQRKLLEGMKVVEVEVVNGN